jgi:hypothetical protein
VCELEQLLQEQDKFQRIEQDQREYLHQRAMKDEEELQEDQGLD